MTDEEKAEILADMMRDNPLARELFKIAQEGNRAMIHELTKDGNTIWVNGVKFGGEKREGELQ